MHFFTIGEHPVFYRIHRQLLRAMKLTILLLIIGYLHVSAAAFRQTVSVSGKDMPLGKVFTIIKKQTGYVLFYDYSIFQNAKSVTMDLKDVDIEEVMKACLRDQKLEFRIVNKTISVVRKDANIVEKIETGPSKTIKVQGMVMNEAGQPLSGANITIKETEYGTVTNAKGEFQLSSVSNDLDKVVVQAYGSTTQRLATENIAMVNVADIEKQPIANVLSALGRKVPDLEFTQTSGYVSAPFRVEIRTNPFFSVNPYDIENIEVLKDADTTAIYGIHVANGPILITTKKRKVGETKFDLSINGGFANPTRQLHELNTQQFLVMRHESYHGPG